MRDHLLSACMPEEVVEDVVMAVQEAMTNAVTHSRAIADLEISLWFEEGDLLMEVRDAGVGFDLASFDSRRLPAVDQPGGRGLFLISRLMDEVDLSCDGGLVVRAVRRAARDLAAPAADDPPSAEPLYDHRIEAPLETSGEAFFSLDWEFRCRSVNAAFVHLFGLSRGEVEGRVFQELSPRGDDCEAGRALRDAMELGQPALLEYASPGAGRWLEMRVYPTASGVCGLLRDVDTRKRTELECQRLRAELARREAEAQHVLSHAPAAIFEVDLREPRLVSVNDFMCGATGYSREELLAIDPLLLVPEPDRRLAAERARRRVADEAISEGLECGYLTKGGEVRRAVLNVSVAAGEGAGSHALVVAQDVTERLRARRALERSEEKTRAVIRHAALGFALEAPGEGVVEANPRFVELLGYALEELRGRSFDELIHPDDRAENAALSAQLLAGGVNDYVVEERCLRKDGQAIWVRTSVSAVRGEGGETRWVVILLEDVSARKSAEDELLAMLAERTLLAERLGLQAHRMSLLTEMARTAASSLEVAELAERLAGAARELLESSHVVLALAGDAGELRIVASPGHGPEGALGPQAFVPGDSVVASAYRTGRPVIAERCDTGMVSARSKRMAEQAGVGSFAALPLPVDGRPIGVLGIGWPASREFGADDLSLLNLMAAEVAAGLANARRYEAERRVAATLKQHFVHPLPVIPGVELAMISLLACQPEQVGGDFHDVFEVSSGRVVALIGDVTGSGVRAAGLAETVRSAVRALAYFSPSPGKVLGYVNRLLRTLEHEQFASALVVMLDRDTGRARMASAGHPPPVLVDGDDVRLLEPSYGPVLGAFTAPYEATEFVLPPGASLILYTDGLVEARIDGEQFGEERLLAAVRERRRASAKEVVDHLRDAVVTFGGPPTDDLEIILLRRDAGG